LCETRRSGGTAQLDRVIWTTSEPREERREALEGGGGSLGTLTMGTGTTKEEIYLHAAAVAQGLGDVPAQVQQLLLHAAAAALHSVDDE
jgi:hypothetical protein